MSKIYFTRVNKNLFIIDFVDFSAYLVKCIAAAGTSQSALARSCGMPGPHVNMMCRNKATPPLDKLGKMANSLGLLDDDRALFLRLGALAHCPPEVRELVESQEKRIAELEAQLAVGHHVGDFDLPPPENMLSDFDLPEPAVGAGTAGFTRGTDA